MGNVILNETPEVASANDTPSEETNAVTDLTKQRDLAKQKIILSDKMRDDMYTYLYQKNKYANELKKSGLMCDVICADDLLSGFSCLLQLGGLGGLRPNTVVLGFKSDWQKASLESLATYEAIIHNSLVNDRGIMIVRDPTKAFAASVMDPEVEAAQSAKNVEVEVEEKKEEDQEDQDNIITLSSSAKVSDGKIHVSTARSMSTAIDLGSKKKRFGKKKSEKRRIDVWWLADVGFLF